MKSLEEIMAEAEVREDKQAADDQLCAKKHQQFLKTATIIGAFLGAGHGMMITYLFNSFIFMVSQPLSAACACYCLAKWLPGMFRGMVVLTACEFVGFYFATKIAGIEVTETASPMGRLGLFMMLLFTIASWPPLAVVLSACGQKTGTTTITKKGCAFEVDPHLG